MKSQARIAIRRLRTRVRHGFGEQRRRLAGAPCGPRTVLLVLGCQRSGTTLITDLLAADSDVKVYPEHSQISARDRHGLRLDPLPEVAGRLRRSRYPLVVLKPLVESQNALALLAGLPNARAIWVFRHYGDVARSNLARFGERNGIKNLRSIAEGGDDWRAERVSARVRSAVARHFDAAMNPYDAAALFWWARNALFFEQSLEARSDVRTCHYEELVADPRRVLRGIYEFAGSACPRDLPLSRVSSRSVALGRAIPLSAEVAALCEEMLARLEKAHAGEAAMRIAQIIDALRFSGGAERLQLVFAESVVDSDVELTMITLRRNDPGMVATLEALGVRVIPFPARRFLSPARAIALMRFLRRESFDVVHTHLVRSTVLGILAARAAAIPTVATLHSTRRNQRLPEALEAVEERVLRHAADRVVAVGWETASVHRARLRDRPITVIPNAVAAGCTLTPADRERIRGELGVDRDELLVIAVGRLQPVKAFSDLLAAIATVCAQGFPVQLRIAGEGPLRSDLRAEIERRGLSAQAQLLGLRGDVDRLLAASDVYASSAASEGLSVAALEAMAAGLPVVATRVGDMPRIVEADAGLLVPPGEPEELARALARVLADAELRRSMGEAGRRYVRRHHGVEAWSRQLLALYAELVRARSSAAAARVAGDRPCA